MKKSILLGSALLSLGLTQAQDLSQKIDKDKFQQQLLLDKLTNDINKLRDGKDMPALEFDSILFHTANNQATYNAKVGKSEKEQGGKLTTVKDRLAFYEGSADANTSELLFDVKWGKKGTGYTYEKVYTDLKKKLSKGKFQKAILDENNVYLGGNLILDVNSNKIFASYVISDINAFNNPTAHLDELSFEYTNKNKYGLEKGWNFGSSWKRMFGKWNGCAIFKPEDIHTLSFNAFEIRGTEVYVKSTYRDAFKKLLVNKSDAFIVDVIDPKQYDSSKKYNITDPSLIGRGYLMKPVFQKKIVQATGDVLVGNLPAPIEGDAQFNIFLYKSKDCDGYFDRSYVNGKKLFDLHEEHTPTTLALTHDTAGTVLPKFEPKKNQISFNIPFEKGKFAFKKEDIQPLIDSLGEPQFIINKMNISAYSSIEGTKEVNDKLQTKRSQSIAAVLKGMNNRQNFDLSIRTNTAWDQFKAQMKATPAHAHLADSAFETVNGMIAESDSLETALEPFLAKQRYAQITMFVTYKEKDMSKEDYYLFKYKKAIKQKDEKMALIFQNQLMLLGEYDMILSVEVPKIEEFATLHGNLIYVNNKANTYSNFDDFYAYTKETYEQYGKNRIVRYNYLSTSLNEIINNNPELKEGEEKITALREVSNNVGVDNIIKQDEVELQKMKVYFFEEKYLPKTKAELALKGKKVKKKKKKKREVNNTIQVPNMNDAICFADLYTDQGKENIAYDLLRGNFNKFKNEMKNAKTNEDVALVEQYLTRMITYFADLNQIPNIEDESEIFYLLSEVSPTFHNKLFDEKFLSLQYFDNLHIKKAYREANENMKGQEIGL